MTALTVRPGHSCAYYTRGRIGVDFETEVGSELRLRLSREDAQKLGMMLINSAHSCQQWACVEIFGPASIIGGRR
ncbi:hypothetical protein [Acuticoccus sediminis]|uniref:hypothetical protein n=1 Tax=Acuticoccus sediminis TaxID=2184697 RepID=UPI001CFCE621|nr:hypothetical protein [Acuticoccus sediminis]